MVKDTGIGAKGDRHAQLLGLGDSLADAAHGHADLVFDHRRVNALAEPFADTLERHQGWYHHRAIGLHDFQRRFIGERAMLDRIDAGPRCRLDPARAMRMGHDFEAERMGGVGDRLHLLAGKLRVQPAPLLRQHATGGGNLDDVGARTRRLADPGGALDRTGAAVAAGQQIVDVLGKARHIAMTTDDRQRRARRNDAGSGNDPLGGTPAQREGRILRGSRFAHGGETGLRGDQGIFGANDHAPFGGLGGFLPEIAAGIAGQMDVQVDQAGHHRLGGEIDDGGTGFGHRFGAKPDFGNLAVADDERRGTAGLRGGIGQQIADADDLILRDGTGRQYCQRQSRYCQAERAYHQISPVIPMRFCLERRQDATKNPPPFQAAGLLIPASGLTRRSRRSRR